MKASFRIIVLAILVSAAVPALAQEHLSERVYVSTDRNVYVSGDDMFLSAFCFDMLSGRLSTGSSVAYVEVISPEGSVQTAKLALSGGRGGGYVRLDNTIPTGQYKLVAYTAQCFNEDGYDFEEGAKMLSIINPFTDARSTAGVDILSDEDYAGLESPVRQSYGSLRLDTTGPLTVTNTSDKPVTLSVSVFNDDGIVAPAVSNPASFLAGATRGTSFTKRRTIDFEGEVVRTRASGPGEVLEDLHGALASLSVPGRPSDFYFTMIDDDGTATFFTRSVQGDAEVVLDINSSKSPCHLEIVSPFAEVKATGLPALPLCTGLAKRISARSISMQVRQAAKADSLYERPALPEDYVFAADSTEYILDDYTRFPLMEELFVEFITGVRVSRSGNSKSLVVSLNDNFRQAPTSQFSSLVLLDGVPVLDQNAIFEYDPLLVERIVVYPHTVYLGGWPYSGVVSFVTYKHNLPSFTFSDNSRIVEYQGVSSPVTVRHPDTELGIPDLRQTLLWMPLLELAPGESRVLEYALPSYDGHFEAVVEGFDADGKPQYAYTEL
jgi:hypothetical protein